MKVFVEILKTQCTFSEGEVEGCAFVILSAFFKNTKTGKEDNVDPLLVQQGKVQKSQIDICANGEAGGPEQHCMCGVPLYASFASGSRLLTEITHSSSDMPVYFL